MDSSYGNEPVSPPDKAPKESVDEQNASEAQILIAKDQLPASTKEGDTCTFKVAKDTGGEFILEYVKEEKSGEEAAEPSRDNFDATTDKELSALDNQG